MGVAGLQFVRHVSTVVATVQWPNGITASQLLAATAADVARSPTGPVLPHAVNCKKELVGYLGWSGLKLGEKGERG